jgi:hypothetical protein
MIDTTIIRDLFTAIALAVVCAGLLTAAVMAIAGWWAAREQMATLRSGRRKGGV